MLYMSSGSNNSGNSGSSLDKSKNPKTYEQIKQSYLDHGEDREVLRKLSPAHIIGIKRIEIEERKLQLSQDALKLAVLSRLMGGQDIVEGEEVKQVEEKEGGEGGQELTTTTRQK